MGKIIVITFAFMVFAFYELSGGSDFVAIADEKRAVQAVELAEEERLLAAAKAERLKATPKPETPTAPDVILASAVVAPAEATASALSLSDAVSDALDEANAETVTAPVIVEEVIAEAVEVAPADIREVTAARVNMRDGPGQNFSVIAKLTNGEQVEILQDPGDGWVKLRVANSGREGWMADFLLTASND